MQWLTNNRPDEDLIPSNIRKWVNVFGVEGDFEWSSGTSIPAEQSLSLWWWTYKYIRFWNLYIFTWASAPGWTDLAISTFWNNTINWIATALWKTLVSQQITPIIWWWNRIVTYNPWLNISEYSQEWGSQVIAAILS